MKEELKKEIKNIYQNILDVNLLINSHLNEFPEENFKNFNEKLQRFIDIKGKFIEKFRLFKESFEQSGTEDDFKKFITTNLKEISEQIDKLEKENLELINEKKLFLAKEINRTTKATKALSAYKFNKRSEPRIIDETD